MDNKLSPTPSFSAEGGSAAPQVLLFVYDVYVLGVDYAFVFLGFCRRSSVRRAAGCRSCCGVGFVEDLGQLVACCGQLLVRSLEFA